MDRIFLRAVRLEAMIGIYKRERHTSQPIELDLEIALPSPRVFDSGKVADTIDYAVVVERLRSELAAVRFGLVEELAERIARILIDEFGSPEVRVTVAKLGILKDVGRVGVVIERSAAPGAAPMTGARESRAPSLEHDPGSDPFAISRTAP